MKQFEDLTIAQLKRLYEQDRKLNPEFKTAEKLLEEKTGGVFPKGDYPTRDEEEFDYTHR